MQLDRSGVGEARQRLLEVGALSLHIQPFVIRGTADDTEDPQRRLDRERAVTAWQIQVADHGRQRRDRQEIGRVEQELPRDVDQLRRSAQTQRDPQPAPTGPSLAQRIAIQPVDPVAEQRPKQLPTKPLRVAERRGVQPAAGARPAHPQNEVLQLQLAERNLKAPVRFGRGGARQHAIRPVAGPVDPDPELVVLSYIRTHAVDHHPVRRAGRSSQRHPCATTCTSPRFYAPSATILLPRSQLGDRSAPLIASQAQAQPIMRAYVCMRDYRYTVTEYDTEKPWLASGGRLRDGLLASVELRGSICTL